MPIHERTRHMAWEAHMPDEPADLWAFITALTEAERLGLLAHCVSLTIDAVRSPKAMGNADALQHADALAAALSLDMTAYWQPTAQGYFAQVPKAVVIKAVREGNGPEAAQTLSDLKKQAMAERAEKPLAGKGWLPELLRPTSI